jgi:uncharacterized protein YciI
MLRLALPCLLITLGACAAARATNASDETDCAWAWILTGPHDAEVTGEARDAAFAGHFANMKRMADDGELLVAGPFAEPRVRDDHRGIFLLGTGDLAAARRIANTDPTARAGVFVFEVEPFRTADPLERLMPRHAAAVEAYGPGEPSPGYHCRGYVLVAGSPPDAAERALEGAPVLFQGRIGAGDDERALACLDATSVDDARAHCADGDVEWTLMPWFATNEIANLAAR